MFSMTSLVISSAERFVILLCFCGHLAHGTTFKYDLFTETDKTKWIQVNQLEKIFLNIQEAFSIMKETQKQDSIQVSQVLNLLQAMNLRLQNVENQLSRIESSEIYVKGHLQQSNENSIKEEIREEQLGYRIEKNHQQLQNRLNEVELNIEKIYKQEEIIEKKIQKIDANQNKLTENVEELHANTKRESSKIIQNITTSHQQIERKIEDRILNTTQEDKIKIIKIQESCANKRNSSLAKPVQNDVTQTELLTSFANMDNKYNELTMQMRKVERNTLESTGIIKKIYAQMDHEKDKATNYFGTLLDSCLQTMKHHVTVNLRQLESKFKRNFDAMINEQISFKNNCSRLQLDEEQLEHKAIEILQKLFKYIDNRTHDMKENLNYLRDHENAHITNETRQIEELKIIIKTENEKSMEAIKNATNYTSSLVRTVTEFRNNVTRIEDILTTAGAIIEDIKNRTKIQNLNKNGTEDFYDMFVSKTLTNGTRSNRAKMPTITMLPDGTENKAISETFANNGD